MKKTCIILLVGFAIVYQSKAQEETSGRGFGGLGYFQPGVTFRMPNDLGTELNGFLREREDYQQVGLLLGGGGFVKVLNKLIVGGGGTALLYPQVEGSTSIVKLAGGGGGLNLGYVLYEKPNWLGYPFIGIGGFAYAMEVENFGSLVNQGHFYIPPGETLMINSELIYLDVGVNLFRLLFASGDGGPALGVSVGYMQKIYGTVWETDEGYNLDNLSDPQLSNFYLKLSLGGGGFN